MSRPARDPSTGKVEVNGKAGAVLAWLEFASRWLTLPLLLAVSAYAFSHHDDHRDFREFMAEGERITPASLEDRVVRSELEVMKLVSEEFPPQDLIDNVKQNSESLQRLEIQVASMDARLSTEMQAIRRLLEN